VPAPRTPSLRLDGRRALVTGASRGIGFAAAAALAQAGAMVTLVARSPDEIAAAAESLRDGDLRAGAAVLDVSDLNAVATFFEAQPAYDVLVNNAGTNRPKQLTEVTEDDFDAVIGLNLKSAVFVAQAATRRMIGQSVRGSVIHMSSQMGHVGGGGRTLYCSSKWGLEGFSKAMAIDLANYGIRSNTVAPTFIETPMTAPFLDDPAFRASVIGKIKLNRLGAVEDIMGPVVFLASEASALMTGTSLIVDGGWTAD
jgi:NAD(P)-dependent dehydrogenase (short-subunit alcohol dehydrogenase family)